MERPNREQPVFLIYKTGAIQHGATQLACLQASRLPQGLSKGLAILQLMRQRGWNAAIVAKRFVIHPQSVRKWIRTVEKGDPSGALFPKVRWNRIDDAVRWAVHELRQLCPEPEMGTRTIARHLIRAGIQISRRSVQRGGCYACTFTGKGPTLSNYFDRLARLQRNTEHLDI